MCSPIEYISELKSLGYILVVTTEGQVNRGTINKILAILKPKNYMVWAGVKPNPDLHDLDAARARLRV